MSDLSQWALRTGAKADLPAVIALWRLAESVSSATDNEAALAVLLERDVDSLLLAEADGEIVGTLIVGWDGWRGSLYRLAVHPQWRRQGVATALVRAGEDRLRALGAVRLTAIVVDDQSTGVALWEALGYRRQANRGRFVRMVANQRPEP